MSPVAPIVIVALIVRAIAAATNANKRDGSSGGPRRIFAYRPIRQEGAAAIAFATLVWTLVMPMALGFFLGVLKGQLVVLPFLALSLAVMFPYLTARYVFVPLGLGRVAWLWCSMPILTFRIDRRGGATLMAAWAFTRHGSDKSIAWLERRIQKAKRLRGASVVAQALVVAKKKDLDGARALFESVEMLDTRVCPKAALRIAREWRIADALARCDYDALSKLVRLTGPRSRMTRVLSAIARRLLGHEEVHAIRLWFLWAIAPRRTHTFKLVQRALRVRPGAIGPRRTPRISVFLEEGQRPIARAMRFEAALLSRAPKSVDATDVAELGRLWDGALGDSATKLSLTMRAETLGASTVDRIHATIERALEEDLTSLIREGEIALGTLSAAEGVVLKAARRVRSDLIAEIETACKAARVRTDDKRVLPAIDEWREWGSTRAMLECAGTIGGLEVRRLAFPIVHGALCHLAVWLFNDRKERAIGNAIFRWLLEEAKAVDNGAAIELQEKNVKCGAL
jgi:hypothetical protein